MNKGLVITCILPGCNHETGESADEDLHKGIHISEHNPMYLQYNGHPLFLFGGSSNDNLHQNGRLTKELDLLDSLGGILYGDSTGLIISNKKHGHAA